MYAISILDTTIRIAQRDLCAIRWTAQILEEAQRNLIANRGDEERIRSRFSALRENFEEYEITGYEALVPAMTCDQKDRHVLAAAIRGGVSQIVTSNVRDFPQESVVDYDIEIVTPDDFLTNVLHAHPAEVAAVLREQANALKRPEMTVDELLATLARHGVPNFAAEAETVIKATTPVQRD